MHSLQEFATEFRNFNATIIKRYDSLGLPALEKEAAGLKKRMEDPTFWQDTSKRNELTEIQTRLGALERTLDSWKALKNDGNDLLEYLEIALLEKADSMLPELETKRKDIKSRYQALDLESLLNHEDDFRNAFINIHPGAGGTESHDWADMLYRAYLRWCEKRGYATEILDYQEGEEAGIKNVTILVKGLNAYGYLKCENGVHRLVRISPFDSNKKRHTSFASVHTSAELSDDIEVEINDKDLRVDTYRASGAGGQHINKTDSAVRITHSPSGIVVSCQNERSQIKNRSTAMKMLKARLYELAQEEKKKEIDAKSGERKDISWGNQIRSYVFHPYQLVKDLRTGHERSDTQTVMDGDFDSFIDAYLRSPQNT